MAKDFPDSMSEVLNAVPQIIRTGYVGELPDDGQWEIGIGDWWGAPYGDGSVSVLGGATYTIFSNLPTGLGVNIGGWGSNGALIVDGAGSQALVQAPANPDSQTWVAFGVDDGVAALTLTDGGALRLVGQGGATSQLANLGIGEMFSTATATLNNGHIGINGYDTAYLSVGAMDSTAVMSMTNGSTVAVQANSAARLWVGSDGGNGMLSVHNSTVNFSGLDEIMLGQSAGWDPNAPTYGELELRDGAQFTGIAGTASDAQLRLGVGIDGAVGRLDIREGTTMALSQTVAHVSNDTIFDMDIGVGIAQVTDINGDPVNITPIGEAQIRGDMSVSGFGLARVRIDNGELYVNGGTMTFDGADRVDLAVSRTGLGEVSVSNGGLLDLGGQGHVYVGGMGTLGVAGSGNLTIAGAGSRLIGVHDAWIGVTPEDLGDGTVTPANPGTLTLVHGGVFGNAGATTNISTMGTLNAMNATVGGNLNLHNGFVSTVHAGTRVTDPVTFETFPNTLHVTGNLTNNAGNATIFMGYTPNGADQITVDGGLAVNGGRLEVMLDGNDIFYQYAQGMSAALITYENFSMAPGAEFVPILSHSFLMPNFAYSFALTSAGPGALVFEALNNHDGSGTATLDFTGGNTAVNLAVDASGPITEFAYTGGGLLQGFAVNAGVVRGTAQNDVLDFTGLTTGIEAHGGAGNDTIRGGSGNDVLMGGVGDDLINGGGGNNIAVFTGNFADYLIALDHETRIVSITDTRAGAVNEGSDTLVNIQTMRFADGDRPVEFLTFDLGLDVVPMGPKATVDSGVTSGAITPFAVALANGSYAVLHAGPQAPGNAPPLFGRIVGPDGQPTGATFDISQGTQNNAVPVAATHADGTFTVVWQAVDSGGPVTNGIYSERFDANGVPVAGTRVLVNPDATGDQVSPAIAVSQTSGYTLTGWIDLGGGGAPAGVTWKLGALAPAHLSAEAGATYGGLKAVALPGGDFLLVWGQTGGTVDGAGGAGVVDRDIIGQRIGMDGTPQGASFRINSDPVGQQNDPFVTTLADGAVLVTWQDRDPSSGDYRLWGQKVSAAGVLQGSAMELSDRSINPFVGDTSEAVAAMADGGFVVVFKGALPGGETQILGRRFDAEGTPFGDAFVVEQNPAGESLGMLHVVGLDGGGFAVTWADVEGGVWTTQTRAYTPQFAGSSDAETLTAPTDLPTLLHGLDGNDTLTGGGGDDTLMGGLGDDVIDGGLGLNTAVFSGNRADYTVVLDSATGIVTVTDNRTGPFNEGTDTLSNIALLQFADQTIESGVPAMVTLSGAVSIREVNPGAVNAAGTTVRFTETGGTVHTTTTDANGAYSFTLEHGTTGTLETVREYSTAAPNNDKVLDIFDVIAMFNLVSGSVPASNYDARDIIAADYTGDGSADIFDVIALFNHVAANPGASAPRYIFVDDAADLSGVTFASVPLPSALSVDPLTANASVNMTEILTGDLFGYV